MDPRRVRILELKVKLDRLQERDRVLVCGIMSSAFIGVLTGVLSSASGAPVCIAGASISLAVLVERSISLEMNKQEQRAIKELLREIERQIGQPLQVFMQNNPMAQAVLQPAQPSGIPAIAIINSDGSDVQVAEAEEVPDVSAIGAGRPDRQERDQAEGLGEGAVSNPMRRSRIADLAGVPNPMNLPVHRGYSYPRVGSITTEYVSQMPSNRR